MIRIVALLSAVIISMSSFAQTKESNIKIYNQAVELCKAGDHLKAVDLFKRVYKSEPENVDLLYNLGQCYLNSNNGSDSAAIYFEKAVSLLNKEKYNTDFGIDLFMSLAKAKQYSYKFQEAIDNYNNVLGFIDPNATDFRGVINREIEISKNGIEFMKHPVKLEVKNLGSTVNSKYDDHSPLVNADESLLLFTSRRISSYSEMMDDGQFSEKVFSSKKVDGNWSKSEVVKSVVTRDSHESVLCLSADGTELYMLVSNFDGQNIYVSNFDGETWSEPYMLPEGINSRFNETHASINADKSVLYFTSDRRGGLGGLDIYMVRKLPNGEWGLPKNLGESINTPYDEETPMIHPDGKTLYFSSKGHNTMGNYDIFYSQMNADSTWSEPVNMGYPINTPDDDFFFVPIAAENKAYMASSRFEDNYGGSDLYVIEYEEPVERRLAVIRGQLKSEGNADWDEVRIRVTEKGNTDLIGEYKPNPATGKYVMILEADKDYDVAYVGNGFESKKDELRITKEMTYRNLEQSYDIDNVVLTTIATPQEEKVEVVTLDGKYTVQFLTLKKLVENHKDLRKLDASKIVVYKCKDGNFRYVYGGFKTYKDAQKVKDEVKEATGYDDPFIRYIWQLEKMKVE